MARIVSPGDILRRMDLNRMAVYNLNEQIKAHRAELDRAQASFIPTWRVFREQYLSWYRDNAGVLSRLTGSTMDEAEGWSSQINTWRAQYSRLLPSDPALGPPMPPAETTIGDDVWNGTARIVQSVGDSQAFSWFKALALVAGGIWVATLLAPKVASSYRRTRGTRTYAVTHNRAR